MSQRIEISKRSRIRSSRERVEDDPDPARDPARDPIRHVLGQAEQRRMQNLDRSSRDDGNPANIMRSCNRHKNTH